MNCRRKKINPLIWFFFLTTEGEQFRYLIGALNDFSLINFKSYPELLKPKTGR